MTNMDNVDSTLAIALEIDPIDRWTVFNRLQELSIPCQCSCNQPLCVDIATVASALQVWSVIQQVTQSRGDLVSHLERCWRQMVAL